MSADQPALPGVPPPAAIARYPPPPRPETVLPALGAVIAAIGLQFALPDRVAPGPHWLAPALEVGLLLGLVMTTPRQLTHEHRKRRAAALSATAFVSAANIAALVLLSHQLLEPKAAVTNGRELIVAGSLIWLTNVLIFALWYWETDRGGPGRRAAGHDLLPDFLFVQMTDGVICDPTWRPAFLDYLYLSLTNATAFSPTDTMPLSLQAKAIMGLQSIVSLVTLGLVVSRAVNILA